MTEDTSYRSPPPLDETSLRIVEDFESAWESGRPELALYLDKHPQRTLPLLLELAAIDLENRIKRGEDPGVEEYEAAFPDLAADAAALADLRQSVRHFRARHGVQARFPCLSAPARAGSLGAVAHYSVMRIIGQGAFGTVFEAFDEKLHRTVAIKMLSPELAATSPPRKRFLREARSMAAVSHGNLVRIYAVEEQPVPYIVMEFVDGMTLQQRMDTGGPFSAPEVVHISRQVAAALAAAHDIGLVHRDIKPSNVLLERGPNQMVKLTDFGLARAADDASMTRTGTVLGTPMYMSPEQAVGGAVDHRTDLFSLGTLMYVMTSGRLPFRAPSTIAVLKRLVDEKPRPITEIIPETPRWLTALISRLHAKRPEDRIQTAREVERLLAKAQTEGAVDVSQSSDKAPAAAGRAAAAPAAAAVNVLGWVTAAVAIAALAGAAAWYGGAGKTTGVALVPAPSPPAIPAAAPPTPPTAAPAPTPPLAVVPFDAVQARRHQKAWAKHLGIEVETTNSIGQMLVVIPPGWFTMGGAVDKTVDVTLTKPFLLGQTEVTQGQWKEVMGTEPWKGEEYTTEGADVAATFVSWGDAVAFCGKLTERERASGTISHEQAYRLPTEAEWEFACRAGTVTRFSFGDDDRLYGGYAWTGGDLDPKAKKTLPIPGGNTAREMFAHAVKLKQSNPFGLYDMYGNVWEWCADWYGDYSETPVIDPRGSPGSNRRVLRGSCWAQGPCRSTDRGSGSYADAYRGWRVVLSPPEPRSPQPLEAASPSVSPSTTLAGTRASKTGPAAPPRAVAPFDAAQAKKHQEAWAKHLGVPGEMTDSVGQTLVLIPPGRFRNRRPPDGSVEVSITAPFLIGQTEVTQSQWWAVMETEPWKDREYVMTGDDVAASYVSWHDAVAFCRKLTARDRDSGALGLDQEYRLPTEAEWEHACRAGTDTERFFRKDVDPKAPDPEGETVTGKYAWFSAGITPPTPGGSVGSELFAHAVKQKLPNAWGLYDVNGNVFEWVNDWFVERRPFIAIPLTDPQGPEPDRDVPGGIPQKTVKGGNWVDEWKSLTSSNRYHFPPNLSRYSNGFRVLRTLGTPTTNE